MKFLFGVAVGALGIWAYQSGKLTNLTGSAPAPVQQAFNTAGDRINQVVSSDSVQRVTSSLQANLPSTSTSPIARPSAAEVAGRPADPLPGQHPEGITAEQG